MGLVTEDLAFGDRREEEGSTSARLAERLPWKKWQGWWWTTTPDTLATGLSDDLTCNLATPPRNGS
jgi:hypothetical protein